MNDDQADRISAKRLLIAVLASLALMFGLLGGSQEVSEEGGLRSEQVVRGEELYRTYCLACHGIGEEGEVRTAPKLIGPGHMLADRMHAQRLYNYMSVTMPLDRPGTLEEEEYWAILAFILHANNLLPEALELGPDNAEDVSLVKSE
jgi:mono/diheme cytochrome c family protein